MKIKWFFYLSICFFSFSLPTQTKSLKITWKTLSEIDYKEVDYKDESVMFVPVFSQNVKKINGKKISISGFIVPITKSTYAISRYDMASCFFCGNAGPESIIGLKFKKNPGSIKTDSFVTIEGFLKLNDSEPEEWVYSCEKVEIISLN